MGATPVAGETFTFPVSLRQQADGKLLQSAPTIQAGDFTRSINGAAFGNLDNLPTVTPAAGYQVRVVISAAETTAAGAGGDIEVVWHDAVGAQWDDDFAVLKVAARELDDLAYPTVSGRSIDVDADGGVEVDTIQAGGIANAAFALGAISEDVIAPNSITSSELADSAAAKIAAAVVANSYFAGITSLAAWLGALAGKTASAAVLAEINATVAGATYNNLTDSLEALRDWLAGATTITVVSVLAGGNITVRPYATWSISISGLGSLVGRTKLYFTVKEDPATEADSAALLQVEETAGLVYINGAAGVGANATLVVTDAVAGNITITVNKSQTGLPQQAGYKWDVKMGIAAGADSVKSEGEFNIGQAVTRTTA